MKVISLWLSTIFFAILAVIILLFAFTPEKCEHEDVVTIYSFQFENSTAASSYRPYCRECESNATDNGYTLFRGTPTDQSYLEAMKEHSDARAIVPGEYYTVTAIVTVTDHDFDRTRVNCEVANENFIVRFSVEFREEFEEQVRSVEAGDEITFRGRFYDEGCGFTDAELINTGGIRWKND